MKKLVGPFYQQGLIIIGFMFFALYSFGQKLTLFTNGDFENYSTFHSGGRQAEFAKGLMAFSFSPDYFNDGKINTFSYRTVSPFSGNACIGMFAGNNGGANNKSEMAIAILDNPTVNGLEYSIDCYLFGENQLQESCKKTDSSSCYCFGFYFFNSNCTSEISSAPFISVTPDPDVSIADSLITQGAWIPYHFLYQADDVYDNLSSIIILKK